MSTETVPSWSDKEMQGKPRSAPAEAQLDPARIHWLLPEGRAPAEDGDSVLLPRAPTTTSTESDGHTSLRGQHPTLPLRASPSQTSRHLCSKAASSSLFPRVRTSVGVLPGWADSHTRHLHLPSQHFSNQPAPCDLLKLALDPGSGRQL